MGPGIGPIVIAVVVSATAACGDDAGSSSPAVDQPCTEVAAGIAVGEEPAELADRLDPDDHAPLVRALRLLGDHAPMTAADDAEVATLVAACGPELESAFAAFEEADVVEPVEVYVTTTAIPAGTPLAEAIANEWVRIDTVPPALAPDRAIAPGDRADATFAAEPSPNEIVTDAHLGGG